MNNYGLLYQNKNFISEDETESSDDETNSQLSEENVNLDETKYVSKEHNILISSIDRNWLHPQSSTFHFPIKFNTSETSLELQKIYTGHNQSKIVSTTFQGSETLSIPMCIKNVESIHIEHIIIPNRKNYLLNGNFEETINFSILLVEFQEFTNNHLGSNEALNKSFSAMCGVSSFDGLLNYIIFQNLNTKDRVFRPAPLNNISNLTLNILDFQGNPIRYQNEYLSVKQIIIEDANPKFIKIVTQEYFCRHNYKECDIVQFKGVNTSHHELNQYINQKAGHKIYFESTYVRKIHLESLENLDNVFYISRMGEYDNTNGQFTVSSKLPTNLTETVTGNLINKNLQIIIKMKIESKEKDFEIFNPQII